MEASVQPNKSLDLQVFIEKVIGLVIGPCSSLHVKCWTPLGHFMDISLVPCDVQILKLWSAGQVPSHALGDHRWGRCWGPSSHSPMSGPGHSRVDLPDGKWGQLSHGHDFGADSPIPTLTVLAHCSALTRCRACSPKCRSWWGSGMGWQGSTREPTLLAQVWVSQFWKAASITHLSCGGMDRKGRPTFLLPPCPSMPRTGGRASLVVIREGKLSLTPTNFKTWENRPCPSPGQHNRAC